jgi:hypothetical protein
MDQVRDAGLVVVLDEAQKPRLVARVGPQMVADRRDVTAQG